MFLNLTHLNTGSVGDQDSVRDPTSIREDDIDEMYLGTFDNRDYGDNILPN